MAKSESTKIEFGYFHDYESEQFAFYRIPKVLFTDEYFRNLSSDAKVLYGLMLDRMALSIRHQWFDEEGKVYIIFTVEQVIQYMNCGRDKAMKTLAELDTKKGIGLIERVKQGFGKPDIIYVKNFILRTSKDVKNNDESEESIQQNREVEEVDLSESEKSTYRGRKNRLQGVGKTDFKRSEKPTSGTRKIRLQEVGKTDFKRSEIQSLFILTIIRLSLIMFIWICDGKSQYLREPRLLWKEIIYLRPLEGM
mgnify:CR=1 FL=1